MNIQKKCPGPPFRVQWLEKPLWSSHCKGHSKGEVVSPHAKWRWPFLTRRLHLGCYLEAGTGRCFLALHNKHTHNRSEFNSSVKKPSRIEVKEWENIEQSSKQIYNDWSLPSDWSRSGAAAASSKSRCAWTLNSRHFASRVVLDLYWTLSCSARSSAIFFSFHLNAKQYKSPSPPNKNTGPSASFY